MSKHYTYYAIVDQEWPVDNPWVVVRVGSEGEQFYSANLRWQHSDLLYRIESGREYYQAVPISQEQGERFEQLQAERVEAARKRNES